MDRFKALSPFLIAVVITIVYTLLIYGIRDYGQFYNDSGIFLVQLDHFLQSNFSSFAYQNPTEAIDPEYEFFAFRKNSQFFVDVGSERFIVFPPFLTLLSAPLYAAGGEGALYLLNLVFLAATLLVLIQTGRDLNLGIFWTAVGLIAFSFSGSASLYTVFYHENSLVLFLLSMVTRYYILFMMNGKVPTETVFSQSIFGSLVFAGFLAGLVIWFRIEAVFFFVFLGISVLTKHGVRKIDPGALFSFALGGIFPVVFWLAWNVIFYGHPLGLRFATNILMESKESMTQWELAYHFLFGKDFGLFQHYPFLIFAALPAFHNVGKQNRAGWEARLSVHLSSVFFATILVTVALAPNTGGHFAPRYLFPPFFAGLIVVLLEIRNLVQMKPVFRYPLMGVFVIGLFMGFSFWFRFLERTVQIDRIVGKTEELFLREENEILVFPEYESIQSLPETLLRKKVFVVPNQEKFSLFINRLSQSGFTRFTVARLIPAQKTNLDDSEKFLQWFPYEYQPNEIQMVSKEVHTPYIFYRVELQKKVRK